MTQMVNFPQSDSRYVNSGENGLFVRLVVEYNNRWMATCGGSVQVQLDELLVGVDRTDVPDCHCETCVDYAMAGIARLAAKCYHYPGLDDGNYTSIDYLAAVTLGAIAWSGYDHDVGEYWHCTYDDLTGAGKALYDSLSDLYGSNAKITLQTWLDT